MSCRQPAEKIPKNAATAKEPTRPVTKNLTTEDAEDTEAFRGRIQWIFCVLRSKAFSLVSNDRHLSRLERFQKAARLRQIEFLVPRFDAQEKPVPARQRESRDVEHRVIRLRQAVERQHPEHGSQRRA